MLGYRAHYICERDSCDTAPCSRTQKQMRSSIRADAKTPTPSHDRLLRTPLQLKTVTNIITPHRALIANGMEIVRYDRRTDPNTRTRHTQPAPHTATTTVTQAFLCFHFLSRSFPRNRSQCVCVGRMYYSHAICVCVRLHLTSPFSSLRPIRSMSFLRACVCAHLCMLCTSNTVFGF